MEWVDAIKGWETAMQVVEEAKKAQDTSEMGDMGGSKFNLSHVNNSIMAWKAETEEADGPKFAGSAMDRWDKVEKAAEREPMLAGEMVTAVYWAIEKRVDGAEQARIRNEMQRYATETQCKGLKDMSREEQGGVNLLGSRYGPSGALIPTPSCR